MNEILEELNNLTRVLTEEAQLPQVSNAEEVENSKGEDGGQVPIIAVDTTLLVGNLPTLKALPVSLRIAFIAVLRYWRH